MREMPARCAIYRCKRLFQIPGMVEEGGLSGRIRPKNPPYIQYVKNLYLLREQEIR